MNLNHQYKFLLENKSSQQVIFNRQIAGIGHLSIRNMSAKQDVPIIHNWVMRDYAKYWGMQGKTLSEIEQEYSSIIESNHAMAYIGLIDDKVAFLVECYQPANDPVGNHYTPQPGDVGMHLLLSPPDSPVKGFSWQIFSTVMEFIFSDAQVRRIVVEPDCNNEKIHTLNKKAGFIYEKKIKLPHKEAYLGFCTRSQFKIASLQSVSAVHRESDHPKRAIAHLQAPAWSQANRMLIVKAISEFSHERILKPQLCYQNNEWGHYKLVVSAHPDIEYWFRAQVLSLDHWYIDHGTLTKKIKGEITALDGVMFFQEFKGELGIAATQLPEYMEEITNTLYGSAFMLMKGNPTSSQLVDAEYQTFEHAMTAGHPCFVANNGRMGFDTKDYHQYAPEAGKEVQLIWLAGHKKHAQYNAVENLNHNILLQQELGKEVLHFFRNILISKNLNPEDYYFIPVHPWQWFNKLAMIFAADIAANQLVCLGYGPDNYMAQQSIRTFYNTSNPHKHYTKTALSVLNMGFVRGLTPYYMDSTPPITDWIKQTIAQDEYIQNQGFVLLCEVATVGYRNAYYEQFGKTSAYNKMLAALWRESPATVLSEGQQLMTMAALLHIDHHGEALLPELIAAANISPEVWLKKYLNCYLKPILHCFYEYELVFMPHGENLILILENHVPVKAIMKDISEEVIRFGTHPEMPAKAQRICVEVPEALKILSIFTDVFDCFFRFINQILVQHCAFRDDEFWQLVAESIYEYQAENPQLSEQFDRYDLFAPDFTLSCLNRLQLKNHKQMLDLADPVGSLQFAGTLKNPITKFRKQKHITAQQLAETNASIS